MTHALESGWGTEVAFTTDDIHVVEEFIQDADKNGVDVGLGLVEDNFVGTDGTSLLMAPTRPRAVPHNHVPSYSPDAVTQPFARPHVVHTSSGRHARPAETQLHLVDTEPLTFQGLIRNVKTALAPHWEAHQEIKSLLAGATAAAHSEVQAMIDEESRPRPNGAEPNPNFILAMARNLITQAETQDRQQIEVLKSKPGLVSYIDKQYPDEAALIADPTTPPAVSLAIYDRLWHTDQDKVLDQAAADRWPTGDATDIISQIIRQKILKLERDARSLEETQELPKLVVPPKRQEQPVEPTPEAEPVKRASKVKITVYPPQAFEKPNIGATPVDVCVSPAPVEIETSKPIAESTPEVEAIVAAEVDEEVVSALFAKLDPDKANSKWFKGLSKEKRDVYLLAWMDEATKANQLLASEKTEDRVTANFRHEAARTMRRLWADKPETWKLFSEILANYAAVAE